jgi:hypothetical protein
MPRPRLPNEVDHLVVPLRPVGTPDHDSTMARTVFSKLGIFRGGNLADAGRDRPPLERVRCDQETSPQ